jgi:hypothetical protein
MEEEIADTESLAIFVYDSGKMKTDGVHWRALLPSRDGERSLFRVDELSEPQIAEIGRSEAAENRDGQRLQGWARLVAREVRTHPPLELKADEPPPRHAVIRNWPAELQDRNRLAMALADVASTYRATAPVQGQSM